MYNITIFAAVLAIPVRTSNSKNMWDFLSTTLTPRSSLDLVKTLFLRLLGFKIQNTKLICEYIRHLTLCNFFSYKISQRQIIRHSSECPEMCHSNVLVENLCNKTWKRKKIVKIYFFSWNLFLFLITNACSLRHLCSLSSPIYN